MIKRKFDAKSIITDIKKSGYPSASAYIMQNIKNNFNNFITSDWRSITHILTSEPSKWNTPQECEIPSAPSSNEEEHIVAHADDVVKFLGLPFLKVSKTNIPDNAVIAFGSRFYSSDEQKSFALKHDMSIAKSPAKTQYYILTPDEDMALSDILNFRGGTAIKQKKLSCVVATSQAVVASIDETFNSSVANQSFVTQLLATKGANAAALASNVSLNQESATSQTDHNPVQALAEAFRFAWLGSAYKSPYTGLKVKDIAGRGRVIETPHFHFDWGWNNREYRGLTINGGSFSDIVNLFVQPVNAEQIAQFRAGTPLPVGSTHCPTFEVRWQTKPGNSYYGNHYRTGSDLVNSVAIRTPAITIDPNAKDHYQIVESNDYYLLESTYATLDRLVGFLSENPDITVVSSSVFKTQLTESNPTLNIATYDSLWGMFHSEDDNTQKTAAKMLQSFDLPEFDRLANSHWYNRNQLPDDPAQYALELAIDLFANSQVTGASLDKWCIKKLGANLRIIQRHVARNHYRSHTYYGWASKSNANYRDLICFDDPPDSMPYADRDKFYQLTRAIGSKFNEYLGSDVDSNSKYWNLRMITTTPCNNKELVAYCEAYTDLTARKSDLTSAEQVKLGYLDLFMRHYVEYTFSRYYLGINNNLFFDPGVKSPTDLDQKINDAFINANFGTFRSKFRAAKAKALSNPVKYIQIITKNETAYRTKYIHNLAGYRSDNIPDYAQQWFLQDFPHNYLTTNQNTHPSFAQIIEVFDYYLANL